MFSFLTELQINLCIGFAALTSGVIFSQQIKDKLKGIPGDVRTALKGVELDTVSKIKVAQATVLAQLPTPPAPKISLAPAPLPPLPVAPAPAPEPAAIPV